MATYTPSAPIGQLGRGGSVPHPPQGGGEDGGSSDAGPPNSGLPSYGARLRRARLGLICGIATVGMVFVSLTSALIVRRGLPTFDEMSRSYLRDWGSVQLPWELLVINTAILLISSVTIEAARRQIARRAALAPVETIPGVTLGAERNFRWLGITVLLGFGFLVGQWMAWGEMKARGFLVSTNPESSFIYLLTAAHALHLAGGIVALVWASVSSLLRKPIEDRRIVVDVAAWYWHFMAVLWIYVFALLGWAR